MTVRIGPDIGRLGVWLSSTQLGQLEPGELGEIAAGLEGAGYRAVWVGSIRGDLPPAESVLAATDKLAFASGIVNVWSEPAEQAIAAYHRVDTAYPGRILLGVGAGHRERNATQGYQRPYAKVVDYLDALAAAPDPVPAENTVLAALGPKVLKLAGERTAGAHPYLVTPEHTRQAREVLGAGPLLAPEQKVVLEADPSRARTLARAGIARYLELTNYLANLRRLGFTDADFADGGSDRLVDALVPWGDVSVVAARVEEHYAAGADHVCLQVLTDERRPRQEHWRVLGEALAG
ncbi:MAG TPA: TIGR03620 family F420-dependent LLM class oxidoreductase [Pseudonocardiaceae bacterium]|nr:TIGR03620 family F420-dependent LLM class oxidoreductase [Pseudonocardiaceae bacterium]